MIWLTRVVHVLFMTYDVFLCFLLPLLQSREMFDSRLPRVMSCLYGILLADIPCANSTVYDLLFSIPGAVKWLDLGISVINLD